MRTLTSHRRLIKSLVESIATPTHSFTLKSATLGFENYQQTSPKMFPRAFVYTPDGESLEFTRMDISNVYKAEGTINVDVVRYLQPNDIKNEKIQSYCDQTAADVMDAVCSSSLWTANGVDIEPGEVTYFYSTANDAFLVAFAFHVDWYFDKTNPQVSYILTEDGAFVETEAGDLVPTE